MINKIVVIGGSFNPPTIAHLRLMEEAIKLLNACKGIFVPTSHDYLVKKMKKLRCPQDMLSEEVRLKMLESLCQKDKRFTISKTQMLKKDRGYDFEMLETIQTDNPESEIYFVVGSDKLSVISRWHRIDEFITKFRILIAKRAEDDLEHIKEANPYLTEHWDAFSVFETPVDIKDISSSKFREKLHNRDRSAQNLVTAEVWEIMNQNGKIQWNAITNFNDEQYQFLSNFYEANIEYGGLTYGSAEAAYQAQKCMTEEEKIQFTEYSPSKSKSLGRKVQMRPDWEEVKVSIMEEIVSAKFEQNPDLSKQLLNTGDKILVEGNHWGDVFWGVDTRTGQGKNHLGKILMKVRTCLQKDINNIL